ncbi:MAG: tetratricopeptide repeat protein [Nitrospirae bacterium]|nr:tetratricopeptide repeat protein [Nitrospirota bacterium]
MDDRKISVGDVVAERYKVLNIIGGEGFSGVGVIYICLDTAANRLVALKALQEKRLLDHKYRENFKIEALRWISLGNHPHIVTAHLFFEYGYRQFIECEFIAPDKYGRNTLYQFMKPQMELRDVLRWSLQFCFGMEYSASKGMPVHGDIKPTNLMITRKGALKIADFGPAFTLPWLAPEGFHGKITLMSDIYAFGVVMYQMVNAGKLPFYPEDESNADWKAIHREREVPPLDSELFPIIRKCLEKNPEDRYGDFSLLRAGLEDLFREVAGDEEAAPLPDGNTYDDAGHVNRGVSLSLAGAADSAIKEYEEALWLNPDRPESYNNLGLIYLNKGDYDLAIGYFKMALELNEDFVNAYNNLGIAFMKSGNLLDAADMLCDSVRRFPSVVELRHNLADVLKSLGFIDDAIMELREALCINPNVAEIHNSLGLLLKGRGLTEEAVAEYEEAVRLNPNYLEARINLGNLLYALGKKDEAANSYREAVRCGPTDWAAHYLCGKTLLETGCHEESHEILRKLLAHTPVEIPDAIEKLKKMIEEAASALKDKNNE